MSLAEEIIASISDRRRSPTTAWFEDNPEAAETMREVIDLATKHGLHRKKAIEKAREMLGGPPTGYKAVEAWYLGKKA